MEAAAHGSSTLGIPQAVGQEFVAADKGKKPPPSPPKGKGKKMPTTMVAKACRGEG